MSDKYFRITGLRKRRKRMKTIAFILSVIVVFSTTYSMILPAITLSDSAAEEEPGIFFEDTEELTAGEETEFTYEEEYTEEFPEEPETEPEADVEPDPEWDYEYKTYKLNFNGRVKKSSKKNFILKFKNPEKENEIINNERILQCGKIDDYSFALDFIAPLSPFEAFSISISSIIYKFSCE